MPVNKSTHEGYKVVLVVYYDRQREDRGASAIRAARAGRKEGARQRRPAATTIDAVRVSVRLGFPLAAFILVAGMGKSRFGFLLRLRAFISSSDAFLHLGTGKYSYYSIGP
ncbi:hypothetical protein VPH35_082290 [Triticum aestivum]